jgi:type III pantothenate kinase
MILTLDVGNTRIKGAVFEEDTLLDSFAFSKLELQSQLQGIASTYKELTDVVISSVSDVEKNSFSSFSQSMNFHFVSHKDPFPFINKYETPQTLGVDRLVLATGATLLYPNQNRLIIDVGTCVTYDFVDENNNYLGGAISPGLRLRYKALHDFTSKLPLLTIKSPASSIGKSTEESIHSGVVNGLVFEIEGFIEEYRAKYSNFIIILTGGDTDFLANRFKNTIFANSNFLLESLNQTFQYKIKND